MAPRDDDKAMDGLLRQSLTRDAAAGDCPAPDILAAYQEGSLEGEELARHELHFSRCAHCREQLAAIARAGAEVEIPAFAASAPAAQASPAIAASDLRPGRVRPRRRIWFLDWRFLAPVAAALAFTAVLYTQLAHRAEKPAGFNNEIAMSKPEPLPATQPAPLPAPAQVPEARERKPVLKSSPAIVTGAPQSDTLAKPATAAPAPPAAMDRNQALFSADVAKTPAPTAASPSYKKPLPGAASSGSGGGAGRAFVNSRGAAAGARTSTTTAGKVITAPAPPPPSPAPAAADALAASSQAAEAQKSEEKPGSTAMSVRVQSASPPLETARDGKKFQALELPKSGLAEQGQPDQVIAKRELHEQLIKTPNPAVMYRIADGGFIERTQDSGATWQGEQVDPSAEFTAGAAPGAKVCWLAGRDGAIYLSKDGNNWTKIQPPAQVDFVAVAAMDASSATVTSADGRKFSTRNGGKTWTLLK